LQKLLERELQPQAQRLTDCRRHRSARRFAQNHQGRAPPAHAQAVCVFSTTVSELIPLGNRQAGQSRHTSIFTCIIVAKMLLFSRWIGL
jgi:hypothetical protein